ncbi:BlaI/MecI/CopY family transcriptional regulator [Candidatus Galacturonibacter soehngenii]|uniref:BlaI/MecI/CopY family transcriptional regulator n=2 Tax=Candidatus Galacturonatibacter soehngenii TaxID=2307010 RepID=A0A7V7QI96_9FIRM|nr:BlaI/MecI/CopY family transcriptional regulator [Candidatus Galacturonibacter soehngenii]
MMSKSNLLLTGREMDIMRILWESEKPLVASEITKMDKSLSSNTVQSVLRKLLEKKFIEVADIVYSGTVLTRSYRPTISKKDLLIEQFLNQYINNNSNIPLPNLVATLLKHEKNEIDTIVQLEQLLEERKKSLYTGEK